MNAHQLEVERQRRLAAEAKEKGEREPDGHWRRIHLFGKRHGWLPTLDDMERR